MTLECLCGQVSITFDNRPDFVHECNCTLCRKSGAQWSYVAPDAVKVEGETSGFRRTDKSAPAAETHSCRKCGATTHFVLTEAVIAEHGNSMMGVNMRLADAADLRGIELRYPDGASWDGAGEFNYVRDPATF